MECKDERQTNGTRKLNGLLNNNQAAFRKTGELEFRQGNQVQEMHELHDALNNDTAKQVQYSLKQRKLRDKPEYEEVDDENSKFGPNSIEQHQRPAFYFVANRTPQQAVDRPVLTNNHNNNGRLQEETPVAQKTEFIKARKRWKVAKKCSKRRTFAADGSPDVRPLLPYSVADMYKSTIEKRSRDNNTMESNNKKLKRLLGSKPGEWWMARHLRAVYDGYYGDLDVDDICSRIEGISKTATLPKSKKPTKKKNEKRKSKDEKVVVDEEEQEEMDVDIVLDDNDVASPPTCSISEEGALRVCNPFVAEREDIAEDQKQAKWLYAQDLGGTLQQHQVIHQYKATVKSEHNCDQKDDLAFLDKMWQEFKKNVPTTYQPKTQRT